jgi:hypothetical protein
MPIKLRRTPEKSSEVEKNGGWCGSWLGNFISLMVTINMGQVVMWVSNPMKAIFLVIRMISWMYILPLLKRQKHYTHISRKKKKHFVVIYNLWALHAATLAFWKRCILEVWNRSWDQEKKHQGGLSHDSFLTCESGSPMTFSVCLLSLWCFPLNPSPNMGPQFTIFLFLEEGEMIRTTYTLFL